MAQELTVERRTDTGKGPARRLRAAGRVPGIFYGRDSKPVSLSVDPKVLVKALTTRGENTLLTLKAADAALEGRMALLQDYHRDPVSDDLLHIDLLEVDMNRAVTVEIPIHLTGKSKGVVEGGIVEHVRHLIEVKCLPGQIPASIDVDVTELDVGDAIHVGNLVLPEGVEVLGEDSWTVVTVVPPAVEAAPEVAAEAVAVEGEAAAEGGAPAGEGADTKKADTKKPDTKKAE